MACLGIRHGGIGDCVIRKQRFNHLDEQSNPASRSLTILNLTGKLPNHKLSTTVNATAAYDSGDGLYLQTKRINDDDNHKKYSDRTSIESPRVSEKLDEWIQNSVTEIVKNITQTPLLVQIYADGEVRTKRATSENDWKRSPALEGVILVSELDAAVSGGELEENEGIRAFGVMIQGRHEGRGECKSSCYLLKTSSVNVCTHFCLMKVQSFHKDVFSQFRDCWLLQ